MVPKKGTAWQQKLPPAADFLARQIKEVTVRAEESGADDREDLVFNQKARLTAQNTLNFPF